MAKAAATSGPAVKIGVIADVGAPGDDHPETFTGAEAAGSYVNAHGGFVAGHPVSIVTCNGEGTPTASSQCAQQFVAAHVIAVIGTGLDFPTSGMPILQAANIPFVGTAVGANDYLGPVSYPIWPGVAGGFPATVNYFIKRGIKRAAVITIDDAEANVAAQTFVVKPYEAAGGTAVSIAAAPSAPDFTPVVEKALQSKPQVIFMLQDENDSTRVAQAAAQLGYTGLLAPAQYGPSYVKSISSSQLKNTIVGLETNLGSPSPARTLFFAAMKKYQPRSEIDDTSSTNFGSVLTLQTICTPLGFSGCTASGVLASLKAPHNVSVFLGKTLDVSTPVTLAGLPTHALNPWNRIEKINRNGSFTDLTGKWIKG
jgi:ABC-type branched-subunit amino acid transport system substrate-binding protein